METCVFAGSFDPITTGHLEIIKSALKTYDKVIAVIGVNDKKTPVFSVEERLEFIKKTTKGLNVETVFYSGLMMDFMKEKGLTKYIRGIRNETDCKYEKIMENFNKSIYPELENIFLYATKDFADKSSSLVKERLRSGQDITGLVAENVKEDIIKSYKEKQGK